MRKALLSTILCMTLMAFLASCSNSEQQDSTSGKPYDPNQPIQLATYYPQKGGMATKVIIKGDNFGTDLSQISVYFNEKKAAIVKSTGNMLYVITPRQPGDECTVSIKVGEDRKAFEEKFAYKTQVTVSTITGVPGGDRKAVDGTLSEGRFGQTFFLCVDAEKNIFLVERREYRLRQINEEKNMVTTLGTSLTAPFIPMVELEGQKVFVPLWVTNGDLYQFDPMTQWAKKRIKPLNVILDQYIAASSNPVDKMMYIKALNGKIACMNPVTKEATIIAEGLHPGLSYAAITYFDPLDPNMLYICYAEKHCIWRYNLVTKEYELFAGSMNEAGHADGRRLEARFNQPWQFCFDQDGIMYIADSQNHCIRTIDREGVVSTIIGIPGRKGYVDGTPDDALFNAPQGVAVDNDGTIYIGDTENYCIRKLAVQ